MLEMQDYLELRGNESCWDIRTEITRQEMGLFFVAGWDFIAAGKWWMIWDNE
jgi:hypothetical protein